MKSLTSLHSLAAPAATDRLRVREAAALASVSVGMIYKWIADAHFKSFTVVRRGFERGIRYIDKPTFEHFLNSQQDDSQTETVRQTIAKEEPQ